MPRKAISPGAYLTAWKSLDYRLIHEASKAEASRQVNEMVKWMEWQIQYDPDEMKEIHLENGIFDIIRKARNYRSTIYNRNKSIASTEFEVIRGRTLGDMNLVEDSIAKLADYEDDQWAAARRILKVYCAVKKAAGGNLELVEPEVVGYEYDTEDL